MNSLEFEDKTGQIIYLVNHAERFDKMDLL